MFIEQISEQFKGKAIAGIALGHTGLSIIITTDDGQKLEIRLEGIEEFAPLNAELWVNGQDPY